MALSKGLSTARRATVLSERGRAFLQSIQNIELFCNAHGRVRADP